MCLLWWHSVSFAPCSICMTRQKKPPPCSITVNNGCKQTNINVCVYHYSLLLLHFTWPIFVVKQTYLYDLHLIEQQTSLCQRYQLIHLHQKPGIATLFAFRIFFPSIVHPSLLLSVCNIWRRHHATSMLVFHLPWSDLASGRTTHSQRQGQSPRQFPTSCPTHWRWGTVFTPQLSTSNPAHWRWRIVLNSQLPTRSLARRRQSVTILLLASNFPQKQQKVAILS
jgi:hypothetical protein